MASMSVRVPPLRWTEAMSAATSTFSRTVSDENSLRFWNVRTRPARAMEWEGSDVSPISPSCTSPEVGSTMPVITFTSVVLPAPLGPIKPTISRLETSIEAPSSARKPPNSTVTPLAERSRASGSGAATAAAGGFWRMKRRHSHASTSQSSSTPLGRQIMKTTMARPSNTVGSPSRNTQSRFPSSPRPNIS